MDPEDYSVEYTYVYKDPRDEGYTRKTKRTWLKVIHQYRLEYDGQYDGVPTRMVRVEEATHPGFLYKLLAIVLYPVSVVISGVPEASSYTWKFLFDRRYGTFTSHTYFRKVQKS